MCGTGFLLDTSVLIWWLAEPSRLSSTATSCLQEGWLLLPVQWPHIRRLDQLPVPHKDPFDRLLIAQAIEENLTLLSVDPLMRNYPVAVLG